MATEDEARRLKRRLSPQLMSRAGVCGVGVEKDDSGDYVVTVLLEDDDEKALGDLPEEVEGVQIRRVRSGPIRKLPSTRGKR